MKQNLENSVKRFFKRKAKITLGFMVAFMISGNIGYAEKLIPKSEDTEILLFINEIFQEFDNEEVKNIGEFRLVEGQEAIKPPEEFGKPVAPNKPTEPEKPNIDKPINPEKPSVKPDKPIVPETSKEIINTENKVLENGTIFTVKDKENFVNKGNLTLKSNVEMLDTDNDRVFDTPNADYSVIKNNGGIIKNEGTINIEGLKDVNIAETGHIVKVGEGIGVHQISGTFENNGSIIVKGNGFDGDNDGYIETNGGIGVLVEGGAAINNKIITSPDSYLLPDKSLMLGRGIGMKALNGIIENNKDGLIKNQAISMIAENKGAAINNGTIETEQVGLMAFNGGTAINNGIIKAWKNEKEGHIGEAGVGLYASSFNGTKTIVTNSETGIVYGKVKSEGSNAKVINNGTIYGTEIKVSNGVIENNGIITGETTKPVIDIQNGKFIQSASGILEAKRVNGDIYLSGDYTKNNFKDKIAVTSLNVKEHNGEIKSNSVMYDYNSGNKTLEKKAFSEILTNQEFATYLEDNYLDGNIIKQELYNNLKLIDTVREFNRATNNLFGNNIYPSLKKQTFNMIRFNKNTLIDNVFNVEANKELRVIGGADYKNIKANPSNLAGYDTDIKSVFIGTDKEFKVNHRLGGILNVGTLESNFDMDNARREDTFAQANIYSIYNYNDIQFINNFFIGLSTGELERDLKFVDVYGRQKGDLDSNYLGINNIVTRTFNFDTLYLKPKAEASFTQLQMGDIKENGNYGLVVDKQDVTSIEAGVGLEAGKYFDITDTLTGTIKVYGNYLEEFSDPYKEITAKLRRIDYSDTIKLSNYNDEDYRNLGIRFELSNENVTTYVEYNYNFLDEFFSAGINYRF